MDSQASAISQRRSHVDQQPGSLLRCPDSPQLGRSVRTAFRRPRARPNPALDFLVVVDAYPPVALPIPRWRAGRTNRLLKNYWGRSTSSWGQRQA